MEAAESLRVPMPLGSLLHDRFLRCSRKAATASIGPPSAASRHRTLAMHKRQSAMERRLATDIVLFALSTRVSGIWRPRFMT
jgi:hypothetical protein